MTLIISFISLFLVAYLYYQFNKRFNEVATILTNLAEKVKSLENTNEHLN